MPEYGATEASQSKDREGFVHNYLYDLRGKQQLKKNDLNSKILRYEALIYSHIEDS